MSYRENIVNTLNRNITIQAIALASSILIARFLQPEGKGYIASFRVIADMTASIFSLGLGKAITYYVAKNIFQEKRLLNTAFNLALILSFISLVGYALSVSFIKGNGLESETFKTIILTLPLAFLPNMLAWREGIFRGYLKFKLINKILAFQSLSVLTLILILKVLGYLSPITVLFIYSSSFCFSFLATFFIKKDDFNISIKYFLIDRDIAFRLLKYGIFYQAYGLLQKLHYSSDLLLVEKILNLKSVGLYSTGVSFSQMSWQIPLAIIYVLVPTTSKETSDDDALKRVCKTSRICVLLLMLVIVLNMLLSPFLVPFLYGKSYQSSVMVVYSLLPGMLTSGIFMILAGFLAGRNRLIALSYISGCSLASNFILNIFLIPRLGIVGASLSSSFSYSCSLLLVIFLIVKDYGVKVNDLIIPRKKDLNFSR